MNSIYMICFVVFAFMGMAIFLFLDLGAALHSSAKEVSRLRAKKRSFKAQGKLLRRIIALREKQRILVSQSPIHQSLYIGLTICSATGGFWVGKLVFNSVILAVLVATLALLLPVIVLSFRQNKSKTKRLNRLASSMLVLSNSYLVTEDFIASVRDNLSILEYPAPFRDFLTYATLMDSDIKSALRRLENRLNNAYASQWIDSLISHRMIAVFAMCH